MRLSSLLAMIAKGHNVIYVYPQIHELPKDPLLAMGIQCQKSVLVSITTSIKRSAAHLREIINNLGGIVQGKFSLVSESFRSIDSDWKLLAIVLSLRIFFNVVELATRPCVQL